MRIKRFLPALAAGAVLTASVAPAYAQTSAPGTGTTTSTLTALGIDAGSLLSVDLLSDLGSANNDAALGTPSAAVQLAAATISSAAAGISESVPLFSLQSTGEPKSETKEVSTIDNPVASATLVPSSLTAGVDGTGAVSALAAGLTSLDLLGGIVSLDALDLGLGTDALTSAANGDQTISLDSLSLLDLDSLLAGLGIPLADLPLTTVLDLVDQLGLLDQLGALLDGLGITGLDLNNLSLASVEGALVGLTDDIALLEGLQADLTDVSPICDVGDPALDLLGALTGQDASTLCNDLVQTTTDTANELLALNGDLGGALDGALGLLSGASLLSLDGVDVGVVTKATDDVSTSVADVVASIGDLQVGGLTIPGVDLTAATDLVTSTVDSATGAVSDVLATIDPSLADLVDISALDKTTSVTEDGDTITSAVDFTALRVSVVPDLAELVALIDSLTAGTSIGDQLTDLGLPVPAIPAEIADVNGLLAGLPTSGLFDSSSVFALSEGLTVEVAGVSQTSTFTPSAAQNPSTPSLPRTGSNDGLYLMLGGAAVVAAIAARRLTAKA